MSRNDVILGAVAAVLVVFSLVVSIVIPRRDPGFPGKNLRLFVVVSVALVLAVLTAVELLGESHAGESEPAHETTEGEGTGTGETDDGGGGAAGEAIFASAGCGTCHTLDEAGTSGTVGPNLDSSTMPLDAVVRQIADGGGGMPPFSGQLSEQEIQDVAAFVVASQG